MAQKTQHPPSDLRLQAENAASAGNWKTAAECYARYVAQRDSELALINSVQEGLSSKLEMQGIYDLVGDKLRDTFNAQVVMISQYDPATRRVCHRYAIERGQHLYIQGWHPIDSSRAEIVRTGKPFMINLDEIEQVVQDGKMQVVQGTEMPKTWLGVPWLIGNAVVGVVSLQNLDKGHAFSKSDIDLLMTLTNSMSLSLENARLFSETQRLLRLIEDEMKIARQTQRSILPPRTPRRSGYDFGALITPARAVGGDFYDFIHLDKDHLGLIIGDVADKGLPAALVMALTFSLLRAETERADDPRQILVNVNRFLVKIGASGVFVTLLYGVLEYKTGIFRSVRAGHPLPVVLDAQGETIPVSMSLGQPLGIFADVALDTQEMVIPQGGLLLMYSDGLDEAADAQGRLFGVGRARQELAAHRHEGARTICARLWQAVAAHSGEQSHQDDFVTLVVKRRS